MPPEWICWKKGEEVGSVDGRRLEELRHSAGWIFDAGLLSFVIDSG